jgi:glutamyl-tRNA synthetase
MNAASTGSRLYRGRLAPSPTGAQHIGNARTFLIAWLAARSVGGHLQLRIEDIDSPRVKPESITQIPEDLLWLGLDWDETLPLQTSRIPRHAQALEILRGKDLVYPCTCTRSDIAQAASAPHADQEGPVYPGTCAGRTSADADGLGDRAFAWRFRVRESPVFTDRFCGEVRISLKETGGDFVVWKSSGTPAYQLAVVVDDADSGITEVVRGADLIPSTPRQLLLFEALGASPPEYLHVPLVVGTDGRRLAKRHGDTRLATLRNAGVRAESLLGLLAWSCGWLEKIEPLSARELLPRYRPDTIPREPLTLTPELLRRIGFG